MDYSSIGADPEEHQSPWASSPQQSRNFSRSSTEEPPSPSTAFSQSGLNDPTPYNQYSQSAQHETYFHPPTAIEDSEPSDPPAPIAPKPQRDQATPGVLQADYEAHPEPIHNVQRQQQQHPAQQQHQRTKSHQKSAQPKYSLQAKVNGLERSGRPSKDPMFRFDVHTNLPGYRTTQFRDVRRSHGEFQKLADHLISANPEALVPALPASSTPAGVGTDEDETKVKTYMQRWLNYVCSNDVLMRDDEMVRFVEGDPGYSPVIRRSQPATGVRRKVIKQFAPPPDDTPELQDARPMVKLFYLGAMDAGQKVDKVVKTRRALGLAETDFGQRLSAMSEQETHPGLKNAYRKLGRTIQTTGDHRAAQGTAEATTFGEPLTYHSSDAFIVKETLTNRHILLRELLQAQQTTRSKLSASDRLKSSTSVRRDKVDEAIAALDEARTHETYLHTKTQRVTANLLTENRKWFARTATDLRAALREYVLREIEAERRCLATLEAARPEIRAIDASGGLSRLGREATPAARRATVMSSQGPKGDAWSGVQRRSGDGLNRSISGSFVAGSGADDEGDTNGNEAEAVASGGSGGVGAATSSTGRERSVSAAGSKKSAKEDDDDRVDARNAASRLATSTF